MRICSSACCSGDADIDEDKIFFVIEVCYSRETAIDNYEGEDAQLPHLILMDTLGSGLKHLFFDAGGIKHCEKEHGKLLHSQNLFELYAQPSCSLDLFRRCSVLENLYISRVHFLFSQADKSKLVGSGKVTYLTIDHGIITDFRFKQINNFFPSLSELKLYHCRLYETISINMPKLTLHNINYEHERLDKIYFYIKKSGREHYKETDQESGEIVPSGKRRLIRDN